MIVRGDLKFWTMRYNKPNYLLYVGWRKEFNFYTQHLKFSEENAILTKLLADQAYFYNNPLTGEWEYVEDPVAIMADFMEIPRGQPA